MHRLLASAQPRGRHRRRRGPEPAARAARIAPVATPAQCDALVAPPAAESDVAARRVAVAADVGAGGGWCCPRSCRRCWLPRCWAGTWGRGGCWLCCGCRGRPTSRAISGCAAPRYAVNDEHRRGARGLVESPLAVRRNRQAAGAASVALPDRPSLRHRDAVAGHRPARALWRRRCACASCPRRRRRRCMRRWRGRWRGARCGGECRHLPDRVINARRGQAVLSPLPSVSALKRAWTQLPQPQYPSSRRICSARNSRGQRLAPQPSQLAAKAALRSPPARAPKIARRDRDGSASP